MRERSAVPSPARHLNQVTQPHGRGAAAKPMMAPRRHLGADSRYWPSFTVASGLLASPTVRLSMPVVPDGMLTYTFPVVD